MNQPGYTGNIQVQIEGNVSGQVAIGNNILQIGNIHGGIVNITVPENRPNFSVRPRPVYVRPRAFPGLLDRQEELKTATVAMQVSEPVSIHGVNGLGKTTLLRYLAYSTSGGNYPDGVVYYSARGQNVDDLLQLIFETFYESDKTAKPTDAQLHQFLQSIKALILLDDVSLEYAQVSELINATPQSAFIFASAERCLWGEGYCIPLGGLPQKEALVLLEHELGHPLDERERLAAERFYQKVNGAPLYLIQGAALVCKGMTFADILSDLDKSTSSLARKFHAKLSESQQRIISLFTSIENYPLPIQHIKSLCQVKDIDAELKTLLEMRLIQANSPTYNLTGSLAFAMGQLIDSADWNERIPGYFVQWIKENPPLPDVTDVLNLLLSLLERANNDGRWNDVIALGRGVEKILVLGKRWSAWARVLELILKAAQALKDQLVQGWALHQLGTRSLCLGDLEPARRSLTQALRIREALGDKAGAAITRHNLGVIIAPPAPPRETPRSRPKPAPRHGASGLLKAFFTMLVITAIVIILVMIWNSIPKSPQPTPAKPAPVATTKSPTRPAPTEIPPTKIPTRIPTRRPTVTPLPTIPPCRSGIWYCENFDDGKAQDWEMDPEWSIQRDGSNYVFGGSGHKWTWLNNHAWDDYRFTFRIRLFSGGIHLNYRISDGGRYFIGFTEHGMYISKQVHDQFTDFRSIDWSPTRGDWHNVEIAGWGGHLRVYVDGSLKMEIVDQDYIRNGSIAFETLDNSSAQIDDIEVTGSGPEPAVESSQPPADNQPSNNNPVEIISPEPLPLSCTSYYMTWEQSTDRPGMDYWNGFVGDPDTPPSQKPVICQDMCLNDTYCQAFTYDTYTNVCWLKSGQPGPVYKYENISGIKVCQ